MLDTCDGDAFAADETLGEVLEDAALESVVVCVAKRYAAEDRAKAGAAALSVDMLQVACGQPAYAMPSD